MLSGRGGAGMPRSMRQSMVGLFLLGSIALFVGLVLWLRGFDPTRRTYQAFIDFDDASGMGAGTPVAYRGVKVGEISSIKAQPEGVVLSVTFASAKQLIPSNAVIESNQSGLVGETTINITPLQPLPAGQDIAGPLSRDCNPDLIICNGSRLQGQAQLDVNALIRATLRIANLLSDPQLTANINAVAQNASDALSAVSDLSGDISGLTTRVDRLLSSNALGTTLGTVDTTLTSVGRAADELTLLASSNRGALVSTLVSVQQTSDRLRFTIDGLAPALNQTDLSNIIQNLETLSVNAAQASANLRDISNSVTDPSNALMLQQLLDSARSVFQNVQKITSDLDELTGDPQFRNNLRDLIDALNRLVSSTQQLQQQTQVARAIDTLTVAVNQAQSSIPPSPASRSSSPASVSSPSASPQSPTPQSRSTPINPSSSDSSPLPTNSPRLVPMPRELSSPSPKESPSPSKPAEHEGTP